MSEKHTPTTIKVDCAETLGSLSPIWRSFGYDEINWTYTPRGKRIYTHIGKLSSAPYYIRCHHTFTTGNGLSTPTKGSTNVYHEDTDGTPRYDFNYLDQVFDTMLQNNCKPIVELGFMPDALSRGKKPKPTYNYSGNDLWKYPPKDYSKWAELVYQTVAHYVKKYGAKEVESWYWELWNEPDYKGFFNGSVKEYCKLYDFTVAGAVKALPTIRIGGPGLGGNAKFLHKFLRHCQQEKNYVTGKKGTRLDFISFHAKGTNWPLPDSPFTMPSLKMIFSYLKNYDHVLRQFPEYKEIDILFNECDMAVATNFGVYDFPEYVFNNTEYYPIFVVRLAKNILDFMAQKNMPIKLFTTWAFYFEGKRFFEGNRALFTNENIKKPVFNAFSLLEKLGNTRLKFTIDAGEELSATFDRFPKIDGLASGQDKKSIEIVIWNFDEQDKNSGTEKIKLEIKNLPFTCDSVSMQRFQIDSEYSNSHTAWQRAGSPQDPSSAQMEKIRHHEQLEIIETKDNIEIHDHTIRHMLELPGQSVCLLKIQP